MKLLSLAAIIISCVAVTAVNQSEQNNNIDDPHITTWNNQQLNENHLGQCDLVFLKDEGFENNLGLFIHIRTKIVRHWSYIQSVSIKIGSDVLEIQGSSQDDEKAQHYWINNEYQKESEQISAFPFSIEQPGTYKRKYIIDMSSKYSAGTDITVDVNKDFISIKLNGDESVFGGAVGLVGDYKSGKSLARDGFTEFSDVGDFVDEWQVLPSEPLLFRRHSRPQFPEHCIKSQQQGTPLLEDRRRLDVATSASVASSSDHKDESSSISMFAEAKAACSSTLDDPREIRECTSYVMAAGGDVDFVGEYLNLRSDH